MTNRRVEGMEEHDLERTFRTSYKETPAIMLSYVMFILATFSLVSPVYALEVSTSTKNMGPFGISNSVYLSGPIVSGDAEKVWNAIRVLDIEKTGATLNVTISSPGGSVTEALRIGRLLEKLPRLFPITVSSEVGIQGERLSSPSDCASACVLIYLGGTYRFLKPDSRVGVHQFSFQNEDDVNSSQATAVSQLLAADITEYLREVRVDPALFSTMAKTSSNEIHWIDHNELRTMQVLNEFVLDEVSEYKNVDGYFYLLLKQQGYWGENKIIAACLKGQMQFFAYLQPPDLARVASQEHKLTVLVDGEEFIPASRATPTPTARYGAAKFSLSSAQLSRFASARRVGARMMVPGEVVFFGFEMNVPDGKLRDSISGCTKKLSVEP